MKGTAVAAVSEGPELSPMEDLEGWSLSAYTAEEVGVDKIVLSCEANAAINPLHSGGDCFWLGYIEDGPIELILGDKEGRQSSSKILNQGDYMIFEPETWHGWIPGDKSAKLVFIKLKD